MSPPPASHIAPAAAWTIAPWALGWIVWIGGLLATPKFEEMFRDFGVALPLLTLALLRVSRLMHFEGVGGAPLAGVALWLMTLLLAGGSFAACALPAPAWHRVWRVCGWMFLAATLLGVALALGLPLLSMERSLRGGGV